MSSTTILKKYTILGLTVLSSTFVPLQAQAANQWPSKPITIIVPFAAGGTTDIVARLTGLALSKELKQSVIIENRAGAGGNIGSNIASKAPADGYTLVMGTVGTHAINPHLYKKMPYDTLKDFSPISRIASVPNVLVLNQSSSAKTVKDVMDEAKKNPGKLAFSSSGSGASTHLTGELFKSLAGVEMLHVPYKGSAPALTDLMAGQVDLMFDNLPSAMPFIKSGKLKAIAVTTLQRASQLPDLPTIDESGIPGLDASSWFGLFAPSKTPKEVITTINEALQKVMESSDLKSKIESQGGTPIYETPANFSAYLAAENTRWAKVVKQSGATIE